MSKNKAPALVHSLINLWKVYHLFGIFWIFGCKYLYLYTFRLWSFLFVASRVVIIEWRNGIYYMWYSITPIHHPVWKSVQNIIKRSQWSYSTVNNEDIYFCCIMLIISIWLFWSFLILHLAKLGFIKSDRNYSNGELKVWILFMMGFESRKNLIHISGLKSHIK